MSMASHDRYYLMGDEDGGVGLQCRDCDTGGRPVMYYGYTYPDPTMPITLSIDELFAARTRHDLTHPSVFPSSNVTVHRNGKEGGL
jgi:hypothetical protein